MKKPKKFITNFGVLNSGMSLSVMLYVAMGFFGYIRYGNEVAGSITLTLPEGELMSVIVQILLSFSIYITHALQCYVAIDISWNEYIQPKMNNLTDKSKLVWEYVVRTFTVFLTCKFLNTQLYILIYIPYHVCILLGSKLICYFLNSGTLRS